MRCRERRTFLGRPHQVRGIVGHGDGRGGSVLGFPTANVGVPAEMALPGEGIYACLYERPDGSVHRAAVSFGRRPTFDPDVLEPLLEAYLLDFEGDLYGEARPGLLRGPPARRTALSSSAGARRPDAQGLEAARTVLAVKPS